jgi:hypothetical protein
MMAIKNSNLNTAREIINLSNEGFIYSRIEDNEMYKKNNRDKKFNNNISKLISINIFDCKIANNENIIEKEPFVSIKYYTNNNESCNLCIPLHKCKHLVQI